LAQAQTFAFSAEKLGFFVFISRFKPAAWRSLKTKKPFQLQLERFSIVGVAGFEPTTSCSQSRRDTGLRYTPNWYHLSLFSKSGAKVDK
jgi:hypothetical protein